MKPCSRRVYPADDMYKTRTVIPTGDGPALGDFSRSPFPHLSCTRDLVMLKALIFDMDGTLVHSDPVHLRAFAEVLGPEGVAIDDAALPPRHHRPDQ